MKLKMLENEYWYGGATELGRELPFCAEDEFYVDLRTNKTVNQAAPLFLSNRGRYIWSYEGFELRAEKGELTITPFQKASITVKKAGDTLRSAYLAAQESHFPPSGSLPDELMFTAPQYCTWIELQYEQTQKKILDYAESIINCGMPVGELIIDDGWQTDYGSWDFNRASFDNARQMIEQLKRLGFKVILWIAPYISPDSSVFRELEAQQLLVRSSQNETVVRRWWNGFSAVLDFTNPKAVAWFKTQTQRLKNEYGIDGFKLDGGDTNMYCFEDNTFLKETPNGHTRRWAELGTLYSFNELRASWGLGGSGIAQRLCDKPHSWEYGLGSLIPCAINLGLLGHPFCCPDMIGGGSFVDFLPDKQIDEELCLRWLQASALMPMMQYSYALWNRLSPSGRKLAIDFAKQRSAFGQYIYSLAVESAKTGEPIIRSLEYAFPHQGFERTMDCFMIGKYLVVPVLSKGAAKRVFRLPRGSWLCLMDEKRYEGEQEVSINVGIDQLLIFEHN